MCPGKIFSSPKTKKADDAETLKAQQASADAKAQEAERQKNRNRTDWSDQSSGNEKSRKYFE